MRFDHNGTVEHRTPNRTPDGAGGRALAPDPVIELYKRDVDRTLIREQLRRSVDERVLRMISALGLAEGLHEAGRQRRKP